MQKQRAHIACDPQLAFSNRSHKIEYKCDDINSPSPFISPTKISTVTRFLTSHRTPNSRLTIP